MTQIPNNSQLFVLLTLDVDPHRAAEVPHTELRRPEAPLHLLSRSVGGCLHADLISAVSATFPMSGPGASPSTTREPSSLLIDWLAGRRSDIVSRFNSSLDLGEINSLGQRWPDINVLDQVVYVIREEKSAMKEETVTVTSHVRIPASYSIGVTVTLFSLGNK